MSSLTDAMGAWTRLLLFCVTILLHFEKKTKQKTKNKNFLCLFSYFKNLRFLFFFSILVLISLFYIRYVLYKASAFLHVFKNQRPCLFKSHFPFWSMLVRGPRCSAASFCGRRRWWPSSLLARDRGWEVETVLDRTQVTAFLGDRCGGCREHTLAKGKVSRSTCCCGSCGGLASCLKDCFGGDPVLQLVKRRLSCWLLDCCPVLLLWLLWLLLHLGLSILLVDL